MVRTTEQFFGRDYAPKPVEAGHLQRVISIGIERYNNKEMTWDDLEKEFIDSLRRAKFLAEGDKSGFEPNEDDTALVKKSE